MAEQLNHFFCSVFTQEECSNIPESENLFTGDVPLETVEITGGKVKAKLQKLKPDSVPGPDKLWPRVLVGCQMSLHLPLQTSIPSLWGKAQYPLIGS